MIRYSRFYLLALVFLFIFYRIVFAEEMLSWEDCIREAAKNNPDLIASGEKLRQVEADKKITASQLFPQIDSSLSASTARTDNDSTSQTADSYSYGASGSQLIFDGKKTINQVKAASEDIEAQKENFSFTSSTVRYRLRVAFVDLLRAQEMVRITGEIFDIRRQNLQLITLRYASGLEHKGALLTAQADLSDAEYEVAQAKRNLEVAQRDLINQMGRKALTPVAVKGEFTVKDKAEEKPDFVALAEKNPSLKEALAKKSSAEFDLRATYGDFLPALSASAGANKSGSHWSPQGDRWNLGLTMSLPIFEGGKRFAEVSKAQALLRQLKEDERSTKDGIILTLEEAWADLQDAMEDVGVQEKMLIANEERYKIGQAQYSMGLVNFDNWIIIEDNLVNSKKASLNSQADALFAEAYWIQAKGETLEYD